MQITCLIDWFYLLAAANSNPTSRKRCNISILFASFSIFLNTICLLHVSSYRNNHMIFVLSLSISMGVYCVWFQLLQYYCYEKSLRWILLDIFRFGFWMIIGTVQRLKNPNNVRWFHFERLVCASFFSPFAHSLHFWAIWVWYCLFRIGWYVVCTPVFSHTKFKVNFWIEWIDTSMCCCCCCFFSLILYYVSESTTKDVKYGEAQRPLEQIFIVKTFPTAT